MARPRTPTEVLELRGAFKRNPKRTRDVGAKADRGLGHAPIHLTDTEVECWREIVGNCAGGVLTSADRIIVEMAARLVSRFRADWLTGAEMSTLKSCLTELGWTPASRSKVAAPKKDDVPSEFAEFMN
jgi:hypothetical protein